MDKVQNTKTNLKATNKNVRTIRGFLTSILYGDLGYMNILNIFFNIYFHNNYKC